MASKPLCWLSNDHGYALNVFLYTGSDTLSHVYAPLPQPARIVMHLMQPYLYKGHHVFTDRYYSSIPLAQALLQKGTSFTGTMVQNRVDMPTDIRSSFLSLRNDETRVFFCAGALLFCVLFYFFWFYISIVIFLVLILWFYGSLSLVLWFPSSMVLWFSSSSVLRFYESAVPWISDSFVF